MHVVSSAHTHAGGGAQAALPLLQLFVCKHDAQHKGLAEVTDVFSSALLLLFAHTQVVRNPGIWLLALTYFCVYVVRQVGMGHTVGREKGLSTVVQEGACTDILALFLPANTDRRVLPHGWCST
jgi:hypothetical protein